jgi:hypothetical protein
MPMTKEYLFDSLIIALIPVVTSSNIRNVVTAMKLLPPMLHDTFQPIRRRTLHRWKWYTESTGARCCRGERAHIEIYRKVQRTLQLHLPIEALGMDHQIVWQTLHAALFITGANRATWLALEILQ